MLGESLVYTDGKLFGSDEGIRLGSTDGKVLGTILGNVDGITLGLDAGKEPGSLDGSFDDYNDGKLEGLFLGESLVYPKNKVFGSDEGIKLGSNEGKCLEIYLEMYMESHLGLMLEQSWDI